MTARLTLICHAGTRALRMATFGGDDGLDAYGERAARRLRSRLGGWPGAVRRCRCSPARAATDTARALELEAVVEPALRDCDWGRWNGMTLEQVGEREPEQLRRWIEDPAAVPHGGEGMEALLARVGGWIGDPAAAVGGHAVAVTHPAVVRAAVVHVLGAGTGSFRRVDVTPLSRTELRTDGRRWVLRGIVPAGELAADLAADPAEG